MTARRLVPILAVTALLAGAGAGAQDLVLDALLQRPAAAGTVVVPDRFVRRWDPITVFFAAPKGKAGPEDHPERFARLAPAWPGAWTWLDGKTLQFRPAEPWPALDSVALTVEGRTTVLSTILTPPMSTEPRAGATGLDPVDVVKLQLREPVDPATLAKMVTLDVRELPGLGDAPATRLRADDFEVKVLDRESPDDPASYAIVLDRPIPTGRRVVLRLALSQDEAASEALHEVVFQTAEPFRPRAIGCDGGTVPISPEGTRHPSESPLRCVRDRSVRIGFTAALRGVGPVEGRSLVRFEPAVEDLAFEAGGDELRVRGRFRAEVPYRVSVSPAPGIVDATGRPLEISGESVAWVWFPKREDALRWEVGQGVVELHGPRRVPISGRGVGTADVRIYRVDPLNRSLWPFPDAPLAVDEDEAPPGPGEGPGAWTEASAIPPHELASRLRSLGSPAVSAVLPVDLGEGGARSGLDLAPALDRAVRGPGHFLVGMRRLDGEGQREWVRIQVTDLALTTVEDDDRVLFQVTSLHTGAAVPGATVRIDGERGSPKGPKFETFATVTTGADGTVNWKAPAQGRGRVARIVVAKGDDTLVLDAASPPDRFADGTWLESGENWLGWAFVESPGRAETARTKVHLFPERPIYRPGDPVHLKGYVRRRLAGHLDAWEGGATLQLDGPAGAIRIPVTVEGGSFDATWQEDEPPSGVYTASLQIGGAMVGLATFRVEAFRLPTFEVEVAGPGNATVVGNDAPFDVTLLASYYAGGRVSARPIRWRVTQYPYAWVPPTGAYEGFAWSSDDRYGRGGGFRATPELSVEALTGADGQATLALDPSIEADARPRTYAVEATVTGADDQTVTATAQVHAVPAFVLGLKAPRFLERAESVPIEVVAVGPDGRPVRDLALTVRTVHREWHSVLQASDFTTGEARYLTDVVDVPGSERQLRSSGAPAKLELPLGGSGVWLVEVEAVDALGRAQLVRVDLYAQGAEAVGWEKAEAGTFDVSTDAPQYAPGDTAKLVVRSPFQEGHALVVLEAPSGNRYQHVAVRGGQATVSIPIETGWVPRLPVHVVLRRGRIQGAPESDRLDLAKPQTLAATVKLAVAPVENQVKVGLDVPERALPGKTVPVTVTLAEPDGDPLGGEVTLWLVDQAILALAPEARLDPVPDFVDAVPSKVSVRDTRNDVLGKVPRLENPGGDAGEAEEGFLDQATVRKDFQAVAYYEPKLRVPPTGTLTVPVALPDNVTVWAVRAKAASGEERFGAGKDALPVRLPVVAQPALPRFVRPGDRFDAAAILRVVEGEGGAGKAEISADGLQLTGAASKDVALDPALAAKVAWSATVETPPFDDDGRLARDAVRVKVGGRRLSDGATDAFEVRVPLRDDRAPATDRRILTLPAGGTAELPAVPGRPRPGSVLRTVVVAGDDALVRMAAALDVLRAETAYGTDARLSRGRVALGLGALRGPLGLEDEGEIRAHVDETVAWLTAVLDAHGLVAEWPGAPGRVWLTADAAAFLAEARAQGLVRDEKLASALATALRAALRSDYPYFVSGEAWNERASALWGLTLGGAPDPAYLAELGRNARFLQPESQARLLLAATRANADGALRRQLADAVNGEILTELYQGAERYAGLKSRRTDRTALVAPSEARDLGTMVQALAAEASDAPKVDLAKDALVRLGAEDGWGQANADAAALLALAEWVRARGAPAPRVIVVEDGARQTLSGTREAPLVRRTSTGAGALTLENPGDADATVLAVTRWIPAADGSTTEAAAHGFVVEREWLVVTEGAPATRTPIAAAGAGLDLPVGAIVEEHVRIVNPEERFHVVLSVPLAAGLEPLNPALRTSGPEARPSHADTGSPTWVSLLDDQALYAFTTLPKGTFDFYFREKATVSGAFVQPAARAQQVYDRDVWGTSPGAKVTVRAP